MLFIGPYLEVLPMVSPLRSSILSTIKGRISGLVHSGVHRNCESEESLPADKAITPTLASLPI